MDKLELVNSTEKTEIYENSKYYVKISYEGRVFKKNGARYVPINYDLELNEQMLVDAFKLVIINKETGKHAQKRCYQEDLIEDVQRDLDTDKSQFRTLFNKIDQ